MNCWNCGKELAEGQRFCGQCGADQNARPADPIGGNEPPRTPEPPRPDYPQAEPPRANGTTPAGGAQGDLSILFKIFGFVCAVCYGITAVQSLLNLLSTIFNALFHSMLFYDPAGVIITILSNVLMLALGLFICAISLLIALRRTPENADGLFLCLAAGLLARVVVRILVFLLLSIAHLYFYLNFGSVLLMLLLSVIAAGALFVITVAAGEPMPVLNKNSAELKVSLTAAMATARQGVDEAGSKASSAAKNANASRASQNNNYTAAPAGQASQAQAGQTVPQGGGYGRLKTDRSLLMYILLSLVTCGIYAYYFIYKLAQDVNTVCEGDGKHTSGLLAFILLTMVTCGIYGIWWYYSVANRLAANAPRYGLSFQENGTTVLLWMIFGSLLCGIGSFIAFHIIIKNTNSLCLAYNQYNNL